MAKIDTILESTEFPQLHEIVAEKKLAPALQREMGPAFASGELRIEECRIDQFHYKPGADCRLLFTATIQGRDNDEIGRQIFFGKIFLPGVAKTVFESLNRRHWAQPKFGPPAIHLPQWEMIVWAYPNDPMLTGLPLMATTERVLALAQAAPGKLGLSYAPVAITAEMTKYVPGKRCGYIYHLDYDSSNGNGSASPGAVYGKAYRQEEGEKAYALMRQIWESPACQRGEFILPQPYSYDPDNHVLWQEVIPGKSFAKNAGAIKNLPEQAREIGQRLAAFHGIQLEVPKEMTIEFQVGDIRRAMTAIHEKLPRFVERCEGVGQKLLAAAARLGPGTLTPVHASFKFSHIFSSEKGIAFIDFDGVNLGDPAYDLGRFIAHLYKMKANWKLEPEIADRTVVNFCEAYNRVAAAPVPQERIDWFAASHLLASQVYKSVKRMDPGLVSKLLTIADGLCPA